MGWKYVEEPIDYYQIATIGEAREIINRLIAKIHHVAQITIPMGMDAKTAASWYLDIPHQPSLEHLIKDPSTSVMYPSVWTSDPVPPSAPVAGATNENPLSSSVITINGRPASEEQRKKILTDLENAVSKFIFGKDQ